MLGKLFKRGEKKQKAGQGAPSSLVPNEPSFNPVETQAQQADQQARPQKRSPPPKSFDETLQAGDFTRNGRQEFAEIFGSALVGRRQNFILAMFAMAIAGLAVVSAMQVASSKTAIPWFVEIDKKTNEISKPVRIESIKPHDAVIRSYLANFVEKCFTIDPKMSPSYQRECARMATGRAIEQLRSFRAEQQIIQRIAKGDEFRFARTRSVDLTQPGVAFIYLTTTDLNAAGVEVNPVNYRVRLDYTHIDPKNEDQIIQNPLGLFVTMFNPIQER